MIPRLVLKATAALAIASGADIAAQQTVDILRVDDACLEPDEANSCDQTRAACAFGAMQLRAQVSPAVLPILERGGEATEAGSLSAREAVLIEMSGNANSSAGSGTTTARRPNYQQARAMWIQVGEGLPSWIEEPTGTMFSDSASRERVSVLVPIAGAILLVLSILVLVACRSWLAYRASGQKASETSVPQGNAPTDASQSDVRSSESTRPPSEVGPETKANVSVDLFRFASRTDKLCMGVALVLSSIHGATMPLAFYFCDDIFKAMNLPNDDGSIPPSPGPHANRDEATWHIARVYLILALVVLVARTGAITLCASASDHMVYEVKRAFFSKLMQQSPAWHDVNNSAEISAKLAQDAWIFKEGSGEQLVNTFRAAALFWSAILFSFHKDWQMTIVMIIALPVAGLATATSMAVVRDFGTVQGAVYISAGGIAESALKLVRTVAAFNGQRRTLEAYSGKLKEAESTGVWMGLLQGFCGGITLGVVSFAMSIGLYAGSAWVLTGYHNQCWASDPPFGTCRTGGSIMSSMFTVLWGFIMGLGTMALCIEAISLGKAAAERLYDVIDQPLAVDAAGGRVLELVEGEVQFDDVHFAYPGRSLVSVFNGISFRIPAGATTAFVGPSGSGKSTVVSLLLRFYDSQGGTITLDGCNIRELQLNWLRRQMALVEQEPILFGCSISENISYGADRTVDIDEICDAARMANAYDFICQFPAGFETQVGERGSQLSGGQKQRIAITRALIRDPSVLLLDEATSALDVESERLVQEALDKLVRVRTRTTIVIAHRLTTVQNADLIHVLQDGALVESGAHQDLLSKPDSLYRKLAQTHLTPAPSSGSPYKDMLVPEVIAQPGDQNAPEPAEKNIFDCQLDSQSDNNGLTSPFEPVIPEATKLKKVSVMRLWALSRHEYPLYAFGVLATAMVACMGPLLFMRLTQTVNLFNSPPVVLDVNTGAWVPDFDEALLTVTVSKLCFTMQVIGVLAIISMTAQQWAFHKAGEQFTSRIRLMLLEKLFRQDIAFFDLTTSGALSHTLAADVPAIRGLVGFGLAPLMQAILMITASFGAALYFSWRFTLCVVAVCPLLALGNIATAYALQRTDGKVGAGIVSEAIGSIKTVAAYGLQDRMVTLFLRNLTFARPNEIVGRFANGFGTGLASAAIFLIYFFTVYFGTIFVNLGLMSPDKATLSLFMLISGTGGIAELVRWVERSTEARAAANRVFHLVDREPQIDCMDPCGVRPVQVQGRLEFLDVHFWYPSRPDVKVFHGFDLVVEPNTTVALVGGSGSGKSTAVSLLQRFYNPQRGTITLDGRDISSLNLAWLRQQMGLVQQEPVMMSGTVLENICYGLGQNDIGKAENGARLANAHEFIETMPDLYDTHIGFSGKSLLSGGQKQRLAIARAIVRDPAILLLDEATSALDSASERSVQSALDQLLAQQRRTTIVVAHRLSTVRNADQICVLHSGCIVERGRHDDLLSIENGHYARLVRHQLPI